MKKWFKITGITVLVLLIGLAVLIGINLKDRHPGYNAGIKIINAQNMPLKAGFAAIPITPQVPDRWIDKNNNAKYEPDQGDTFTDGNGNGTFDAIWLAGFGNRRAANGIHDDLWARTMIIDDGKTRLAITAIDAIGLMHDQVVEIRKTLAAENKITCHIITSTHSHEAPDLMGLWGESEFRNGVKVEYLEFVQEQIIKSVSEAVKSLRPAILQISEDHLGATDLVIDTRPPIVSDPGLRMIKAIDAENGNTLGSLLSWANHPETLWSKNLLITSDFPHYFREGVEKGVYHGDSLVKPGIGGIAVYINGAIGGLITTHSSHPVKDPFSATKYVEPSFAKAEAQGKTLSMIALSAMEKPEEIIKTAGISVLVKTIILPIDNTFFRLGTALGVINRGTTGWMKVRSEVSAFKVGPVSFVAIPGEIYPEIVNGGIEAPEGRDFIISPLEVPPVREMMPGKYKFVIGLANDEIGYIIPKSQWDVAAPYTYKGNEAPYGEINSPGKETAPVIHASLKQILHELNQH